MHKVAHLIDFHKYGGLFYSTIVVGIAKKRIFFSCFDSKKSRRQVPDVRRRIFFEASVRFFKISALSTFLGIAGALAG